MLAKHFFYVFDPSPDTTYTSKHSFFMQRDINCTPRLSHFWQISLNICSINHNAMSLAKTTDDVKMRMRFCAKASVLELHSAS